jgi:predicted Zn finger-like uncharacterized protein
MSLATRCNSCGTVFRVVQDQLKVSEGWVRCGRCNEVFNALEGLFDMERESPPEWSPAPQQRPADPSTLPGGSAGTPSKSGDLTGDYDPERLGPRRAEPVFGPEPVDLDNAASRFGPDAYFDGRSALPGQPDTAPPVPEPEFVRKATDRARWKRSPRRALLAAVALTLALLLGLQWAHHFRDLVAARWPAAAPVLAAWCARAGCTIGPLRRIESFTVESTTLTPAAIAGALRLTVTVRNRDQVALAVPSVDLSLTDSTGGLIARRALRPQDFRITQASQAPGADQTMQLHLTAGTRVSGYTVEIFYP